MRHTIEKKLKECIILMHVDNLLTVKQHARAFLDMRIHIEAMDMLSVKFMDGHLNERFQQLLDFETF